MTLFKLPDLGEGLTEAEIVEWLVKEGDHVHADQHLVSVETAKAVVDIPAPFNGVIKKLYGKPGDMIAVGKPLIEFEGETKKTQSTTVAGKLEIGDTLVTETARVLKPGEKAKTSPAVRSLAKQLQVDLNQIQGTGVQGHITREDVMKASQSTQPASDKLLHGTRRSMAQAMSFAHAQVVPVSVYDDANISGWTHGIDITVRTIRAIVRACQAEPMLNAWFKNGELELHSHVSLGLAIDSEDGLFVPVLHEVDKLLSEPKKIREQIAHIKDAIKNRTITPAELQGATFTLSNFGVFAGRYASPIVVPPQAAILATGKIRKVVMPVESAPAIQRIMPLSLTFDHRAVTGGEATRFLGAIMADLALPE
jgi:2-oxoisovalerate dehydrogenase E2 component (dihydrolipoyl transacylase)